MADTLPLWLAPAKLNLFLHIIGRRPDGYHELQTVFQLIDIFDELQFNVRSDGRIERHYQIPGVNGDDLIVSAARRLQQHTGCSLGADIWLNKTIPMGAGLGGGSSDAATTLVALNYLWQTRLSNEALQQLGLVLGADVPVFIFGKNAWAEGVGERLQPVELPVRWFLVLCPTCHVSTADIFGAENLTRNSVRIKIRDFLAGAGRNDCEPVVYQNYPQVAEAAQWLSAHGTVRMSGTGSSVFVAFEQQAQALTAAEQVPGHWRKFVAKGLAVSPIEKYIE